MRDIPVEKKGGSRIKEREIRIPPSFSNRGEKNTFPCLRVGTAKKRGRPLNLSFWGRGGGEGRGLPSLRRKGPKQGWPAFLVGRGIEEEKGTGQARGIQKMGKDL